MGAGWARFMYGGSTGGWEAMAAQMFYPDEYNGAWIACPDPIDFRAYTVVDLYEDTNAYWFEGPWTTVPRPGHRELPGPSVRDARADEPPRAGAGQQGPLGRAVGHLGGGLLAAWAPDGYPQRIWDKRTGVIDKAVAEYWRENYDLIAHPRRDWEKGLGQKLRGQAPHLRRRHGQLLPEQRRLPGRGLPEVRRRTRPTAARWTTATAPSTAGTATHAAERDLAPALPPDVHPEDRRSASRSPRPRART